MNLHQPAVRSEIQGRAGTSICVSVITFKGDPKVGDELSQKGVVQIWPSLAIISNVINTNSALQKII